MRHRLLGLLAVIALVAAGCGGGVPEAGAPSEGIQVHGDWTIDVYNPNGSLDEHREFSNELTNEGGSTLINILTGDLGAVGGWAISLGETSSPTLCSGRCRIDPIRGTRHSILPAHTLRLEGSTTAEADGQIQFVQTEVGTCGPLGHADCQTLDENGIQNPRVFTYKAFDPADFVEVTAGQTIQVQVDISFTSA